MPGEGDDLRWTGIHLRERGNSPNVALCYGNWDKLNWIGNFGSGAHF